MLFNTGSKPVQSRNGLLTTIAFRLGPHAPLVYALEVRIDAAPLLLLPLPSPRCRRNG